MKKVALVEPHGSGGICHYTTQLSNALESAGVSVTLFTNDTYELEHLPHSFTVGSFASSRLKEWLRECLTNKSSGSIAPERSTSEQGVSARSAKIKVIPTATPTENHTPRHPAEAPSALSRFRQHCRVFYLQCEMLFRIAFLGIRTMHIQFLWPVRLPIIFVGLAKLLRIRVVYTAHNLMPHDENSDIAIKKKRTWYRLVDKIIVHSNNNRDELHQLFDIPVEKVSVIAHGNYDFFRRNESIKPPDRFRLNSHETDVKRILFFGAIRKYKGLDVLLPAFQKAWQKRDDLRLVIAGKLSVYDGKDAAYFRNLIIELGIDSAVDFKPEYIPLDDVELYFESADVVALPYLKTYQSGIMQIALAFGKPVIVTNTGGLPEIMQQGESGLLVEPGDQEELSNAMLEIFASDARRTAMGENARLLSKTIYSWDSIARKTCAVYFEDQSV